LFFCKISGVHDDVLHKLDKLADVLGRNLELPTAEPSILSDYFENIDNRRKVYIEFVELLPKVHRFVVNLSDFRVANTKIDGILPEEVLGDVYDAYTGFIVYQLYALLPLEKLAIAVL